MTPLNDGIQRQINAKTDGMVLGVYTASMVSLKHLKDFLDEEDYECTVRCAVAHVCTENLGMDPQRMVDSFIELGLFGYTQE